MDAHGWHVLALDPAIPVVRKTGILIRVHGDSSISVLGTDWPKIPEPAKTLHKLLVEALTLNPIVETQISPDGPKDKLEVTIAGKY